jgi:hypothetical protein
VKEGQKSIGRGVEFAKKIGFRPGFFAIRDSGSVRKLRPIELAIADPAPVGIAQPLGAASSGVRGSR